MKKTGLMTVGLVMISLTIATICSHAQEENKQGSDISKSSLFINLKFTSEQKKKLEEYRKEQSEVMIKLHNRINEEQEKFRKELNSPAVTKAKLEPLVKEITSMQTQIIDRQISYVLAIKAILTPEQFTEFQKRRKPPEELRNRANQNKPSVPN